MLLANKEKNELVRDKTLKASVNDGMAHAVMLGSGETYLSPFAIFLKGTSFQIGLLTTLPPLLGALSQFFGVWFIEHFSSRKSFIVFTALLQALIWFPIALIPFVFSLSSSGVSILIVLAIAYQVAGSVILPAWNSIMGDVVPVALRGRYFGYRNKQTGLTTFVSLLIAGQILHIFENTANIGLGFSIIFIGAMFGKLVSVYWLTKYEDRPLKVQEQDRFSFFQFIIRTPRSNFARFVFFVAIINFAAYIAGPYFAIYLLNDVKISYLSYTIIIATATISQFLTMQYWGKLSDQFGNRKIMTVCGIGLTTVPFLWLCSANVAFLTLIQIYSGMAWAGFNLAAANFMFDAVSPPKRSRCVAYQSIINATFVLMGALLGSYLVNHLPNTLPLAKGIFAPESAFHRIFFLSGIVRMIAIVFFLRMFKEVRDVEPIHSRDLVFRITGLRPLSGISYGLITGLRKRSKPKKSS